MVTFERHLQNSICYHISQTNYCCLVSFRPQPHGLLLPGQEEEELQPENKGAAADEISEDSMASGSSGFGSLPRKNPRTSLITSAG